ncbi:MAG: hypothetical protein WAO20_16180, partial [Acidobacteriota bacterium]
MRKFLPFCLLLPLLAKPVLSGKTQADQSGRIVARQAYSFPDYETAATITDVKLYASSNEYEAALKDERFEFAKVVYLSDGLRVICYEYRPKKTDGRKYPAIVFNRGSYVRGEIAPELIVLFRRLASAGYVILAPLYRGSDGGEGRDEMGGADLDDLLNVAPLV